MTRSLTRRTFLRTSVAFGAGVALLPWLKPTLSLADRSLQARDLVDAAGGFERGSGRGAVVASGVVRGTAEGGLFTSRVIESPISFTHLGLHWAASVPAGGGLSFEARTSVDGSTWSPWEKLHVERQAGEAPVGDTFASLLSADDARFVQYRATFHGLGNASPTLGRVTSTVIDSPAFTTAAASTTVSDPDSGRSLTLVPREQWDAEDSFRFDDDGNKLWPEMFVPFKKLIVHHTATSNRYTDGAAEVRAIYHYHAVTQGWGDIGYHALVDRFGNVYEGRHGRGQGANREVLSAGVVAGHNFAHNYGSAGVAVLGNAQQGSFQMTAEMWDSLVAYSVFESGRSFVRPLNADLSIAASDFLRSDGAWSNGMRNLSGHGETSSTACPGRLVNERLADLRSAIHGGQTGTSRTGVALSLLSPGGRETTPHTEITYEWTAEPTEDGWTAADYEYCIEGWFKPADSNDIEEYISGYTGGAQPHQRWRLATSTADDDKFLGETLSAPSENGTDRWRVTFAPPQRGHYTLHVRAVLEGGERTAYAATHTFLVHEGAAEPPAPGLAVDSINPNSMAAGTSVSVTIGGSGFVSGAAVSFVSGSGPAPSASGEVVEDSTTLTATVAAPGGGPPGERVWDVRVTNPDGASAVLPRGFTVIR